MNEQTNSKKYLFEQLFNQYINGFLEDFKFQKEIESFFERINDIYLQLKIIKQLGNIETKEFILRTLENIIIGNYEEKVKIKSLELIINKYLSKANDLLVYLFKKGTSKLLYRLYKLLERKDTNKSQEILNIMEQAVGEYYLKKQDLLPKEAFGLELLRRHIRKIYKFPERVTWDFNQIEIKNRRIHRIETDLPLDYPIDSKFFTFFSNLKTLRLEECKLTEYFPLESLESLTIKGFETRPIKSLKDIKGIEMLTNLKELNLNHNAITDITDLGFLKNLKKLDLSYNYISKIQNLELLPQLEYLNLAGNDITEIKNLDLLENLKHLDLSENRELLEIKGLDNLKNLEVLLLASNYLINEIKGLNNLKNLKKLSLYKDGMEMGEDIGQKFRAFLIDGLFDDSKSPEEIAKILEDYQYEELEEADKYRHYITEIKNLDCLKNLEELDLRGNHIEEIKGLDNLTNLKVLRLDYNRIKEIKNLENLSKLEFLSISNNNIAPIKELGLLDNESYGVRDPQVVVQYCQRKRKNDFLL
ncbi:MAG: leucine-rich repeat domain-containing protein [Candidatus Lokiarchaeota archaeon]